MNYKDNYKSLKKRYTDPSTRGQSSRTLFDNRRKRETEDENEIWLNTKKAAAYLGITPNALRILVHKGKVQSFKLGSHLRFTTSALEALLTEKEY